MVAEATSAIKLVTGDRWIFAFTWDSVDLTGKVLSGQLQHGANFGTAISLTVANGGVEETDLPGGRFQYVVLGATTGGLAVGDARLVGRMADGIHLETLFVLPILIADLWV